MDIHIYIRKKKVKISYHKKQKESDKYSMSQ